METRTKRREIGRREQKENQAKAVESQRAEERRKGTL
jgi:hypothetical protein